MTILSSRRARCEMRTPFLRTLVPALAALAITAAPSAAAPTLQLIYPVGGAEVEGTINLRVFAYEGAVVTQTADIDSVKFFRKAAPGTLITLTRIANTGEWSGTWNTTALTAGTDTLVFRAVNTPTTTDSQFVVTLVAAGTTTAPTVDITSPAPGSTLSGTASIAFTATAGSGTIAAREISVDGGAYISTSAAAAHSLNTVPLAEGSHTVRIRITNSNGASTESRITSYTVGNIPAVAWTSPTGGATVSGPLVLDYDATPRGQATVASDSLWVDGQGIAALNAPDGPDTVDLSALADGPHTFQVKVTDSNGKIGFSQQVSLLLRNGPTARIDSTLADSTVSGKLVVRFEATAIAPATVAARQIALDGGAFRTAGGDSTDTVDTRSLSEGAHTAQIRVLDSRGKEAFSRLVKFNVKNAPTVQLTAPAVDAYARGTVTVRFTAVAVAPDTVASTWISIGGGDWIATSTDSSHTLDTRGYKDGDLRIQVRAVDGNGKSAVTLAREMVVDNSAPRISYPAAAYPDGAPAARKGVSVTLTAQALDLGAGMDADSALALRVLFGDSALSLMRDDGQSGDKVAGDNVYSAVLTLESGLGGGTLAYSLRGRDRLGNEAVVEAAIAVDNTPPQVSFAVDPAPGNVSGSLSGEVYVSRVLVTGAYSDSGGSGMRSLRLTVRNAESDHVNSSPEAIPLVDGAFRRLVELVPGANRIDVIGADRAGNLDTATATLTYVVPKESRLVDGKGGEVMGADGSGVSIPAGALSSAKEITVRVVDESEEPKPLDQAIRLVGIPHEFGPDGSVFPTPVTVTLRYTEADLDRDQDGRPDFDENKLTVVFWNGRSWIKAGDAVVNRAARTVSVAVNHFTLFDLAEDGAAASASVVAFWDRNPVPGQAEFIYKVPAAGKVSLHVLDMGGDLVKTLITPGTPVSSAGSVRWDGSNVRGTFAGAGLYVYVFKYSSGDGKVEKMIRKPVGLVRK